jgi:putative transport protein
VAESNPLRAQEVDDAELLDIPSIEVDVLLTRKDFASRPLAEVARLAASEVAIRGVFVRKIRRGREEIPRTLNTVVERGDVLTLTGAKPDIERVASRIGVVEWPSETSDLASISATIVIGGLVGLLSVTVGGFELELSLAVGVLLAGLLLGWLRSVHPVLGRVTPGGLWLLDSLGLTGFLACVALKSAPTFVDGLRESGPVFIAAGLALGVVPHVLTTLVGRYVFRVHPGLLLGIISGAGTVAPALAAVQEAARSKVPALAYGVSYAVGNVLLALSGSIIVTVLAT